MTKYILALFIALMLTSCNSVFVWTFEDVFGLSCLGIALICAVVLSFPKKKKK